ncbi:MAG: serine hydrolase [Chloroflexi bacterium]|nr:MAG: serine hydrolase [Chloroflexota bacterium]
MRGGHGRALRRLGIYPLAVLLLVLVGNAAYASSSVSVAPTPALGRDLGRFARPVVLAQPAKPAPPVTTVLAPSAFDQLSADLQAIARTSGGRVGISLQELSGPRRTNLSVNGGLNFVAASTYKLPLLMAEAQQIASGQVHRSDILCYAPSDAEDGWFMDYQAGSCFTRDELALRTGRYSDNTAAHILVRYLGGPDALNRYAKTIGMNNSALWVPNTTTPDDLSQAMVSEALGRLGGAAAQAWLYPILTRTTTEQGIPAGLPGGTTVVHKTGTLDATENDAAYVRNGRIAYVLSVTVDGLDVGAARSVIARISARIWQYESNRPDYAAPVILRPASIPPQNRH